MEPQIITVAGTTLTGEWHHDGSMERLIVICHGYQGSSHDPTIIAITKGLNKGGQSTFTFNFSQNTGGLDIAHQVEDITQIVRHFGRYHEIILLAGSFAALPAAIATVKQPSITELVTLNGFFGSGRVGHQHWRNYMIFRVLALCTPKYRRILKYFKRELRPADIRVPVLVIHSKVDEYVFIEQSQAFFKAIRASKQFITLQHASHGVMASRDRRQVIAEINKWLQPKNF